MSWLSDRQWFSLAVVFYGISMIYSVFLWRKGFRKHNRVNYYLLLTAVGLHTIAMFQRGLEEQRCPINNLYEATVFVTWAISASYILLGTWSKISFLGAFASPLLFAVGVFALMPSLDPPTTEPQYLNGSISLHATLILLSYSAFGLSCIASVMFLTQEHSLKYDKLNAILSRLPPIQRLEVVTSRLLTVGLVLLTLGLAMSPFLFETRPEGSLIEDPKIIWSFLVWFIYAGLVVWRWRFRQGGRKLAWGAVASFAFVMLTFWGTNLMSGIHQQ